MALAAGFVVGTLLALFLAGLGLLVSSLSRSNRVSLSVSLFLLLALFAPTQLPAGAQQGWAGDLFIRIDPFSAGLHYLGMLVSTATALIRTPSGSPRRSSPRASVLAALGLVSLVTLRGGGRS